MRTAGPERRPVAPDFNGSSDDLGEYQMTTLKCNDSATNPFISPVKPIDRSIALPGCHQRCYSAGYLDD